MTETVQRRDYKGTWRQAFLTFLSPIIAVLFVRWIVIEPFVIPSGSMVPNLLVHDHILVQKFSYGIKVPFTNYWLAKWGSPQRGDIVVFRYPENPKIFYVKRLVGIPGDQVQVQDGRLTVNGNPLISDQETGEQDSEGYYLFKEGDHLVRFSQRLPSPESLKEKYVVPEGQYFFMGDNRDQSSDGRVWGYVPEALLVGKAWTIWMSCEKTLESMSFLCDPSQMRWERAFNSLDSK